MSKKNIVVLGSTGTIGENTLNIVRRYPDKFRVIGLAAHSSTKLLAQQVREFSPKYVAFSEQNIPALQRSLKDIKIKYLSAENDLGELVSRTDVHAVVIGMSGSVALDPFLQAAKTGKTIAPANKEALVIAGEILMLEARKNGAQVIPVDSEQSAIFQCLQGQNRKDVKKIYLTASGGALRQIARSKFNQLSVDQILDHPRWKMGAKITVDSASLMNKGFEVIEALRLFDLRMDQIEVLVHPEAIIHSMVEYVDGSIIAQLGITDMQLPIQYALTYPERWETGLPSTDFALLGTLNFEGPDFKKFPSLSLAMEVAREGGTTPAVLNAADEIAVAAFLKGRLKFTQIYDVVEKSVRSHRCNIKPDLEQILAADQWGREKAVKLVNSMN